MEMIRTMLKEIIIQRSKQKKRAERLANAELSTFLLRRGAEIKEYYSASGLRIEFWTPTGPKDKFQKK